MKKSKIIYGIAAALTIFASQAKAQEATPSSHSLLSGYTVEKGRFFVGIGAEGTNNAQYGGTYKKDNNVGVLLTAQQNIIAPVIEVGYKQPVYKAVFVSIMADAKYQNKSLTNIGGGDFAKAQFASNLIATLGVNITEQINMYLIGGFYMQAIDLDLESFKYYPKSNEMMFLTAGVFGIGAEFNINKNLALNFEFKRYEEGNDNMNDSGFYYIYNYDINVAIAQKAHNTFKASVRYYL